MLHQKGALDLGCPERRGREQRLSYCREAADHRAISAPDFLASWRAVQIMVWHPVHSDVTPSATPATFRGVSLLFSAHLAAGCDKATFVSTRRREAPALRWSDSLATTTRIPLPPATIARASGNQHFLLGQPSKKIGMAPDEVRDRYPKRQSPSKQFSKTSGLEMTRNRFEELPDFRDDGRAWTLLNSDQPNPEEGHRLVKALLAIKDAQVRRALIEFAEALAREDRQRLWCTDRAVAVF
ncbi:MAG TPA: hypothetical protein VNR65_00360 [Geobacterales bacterium]|nr:hypothetical protein [Geobacterales bacterium]